MLILHTLSDEDENWSVEDQLSTINTLLHDIYQKFRKAPSLQVGDVRNIGVAPL